MARKYLDSEEQAQAFSDKEWLVSDTWCNKCSEADLGVRNPVIYIENGRKFVEGKCLICNATCKMEMFE